MRKPENFEFTSQRKRPSSGGHQGHFRSERSTQEPPEDPLSGPHPRILRFLLREDSILERVPEKWDQNLLFRRGTPETALAGQVVRILEVVAVGNQINRAVGYLERVDEAGWLDRHFHEERLRAAVDVGEGKRNWFRWEVDPAPLDLISRNLIVG